MGADDWFRYEHWSPEIEKRFFEKLGRARSQRDQYLAIQALKLAPHDPAITLKLVDHFFEARKEEFHDLTALMARAEAYLFLNELNKSVDSFKAVLEHEKQSPNHSSNTRITLPFLIAQNKIRGEYEFALDLLIENADNFTFPVDKFRWQAACALIFEDQGLVDEARKHARMAIEIANIRKSGFQYHQDLGLVGDGENQVVKSMYRIGA